MIKKRYKKNLRICPFLLSEDVNKSNKTSLTSSKSFI